MIVSDKAVGSPVQKLVKTNNKRQKVAAPSYVGWRSSPMETFTVTFRPISWCLALP